MAATKRMIRSSLRDVARLAGVSVPTASQALNGRARISAATRTRVREAAHRLHYTPHAAARRLTLGRSDSVAIVPGSNMTGLFSDLFYRALLSGVGSVFEEAGLRMLITPNVHTDARVPQFVQMAQGREVDGILVAGVVDVNWVREVMETGIPVLVLDNHYRDLAVPAVVNDNAAGAYHATRHLASLGHQRIGFIGAAVAYPFGQETHDGYLRALKDAGLPRKREIEVLGPMVDADHARRAAVELLSRAEPPSAIFAVTDTMALGVIHAARAKGLRIPDDLSVVGMDDIELAWLTDPPLTTVHIRKEEMGRQAAEALIATIGGHRGAPGLTVLANELIVRGTTGGKR